MAETNRENMFTVSSSNFLSQQSKRQVLKIQAAIMFQCCNHKEGIDTVEQGPEVSFYSHNRNNTMRLYIQGQG